MCDMEKHFGLEDSPALRMIELGEVDSTNDYLRRLGTGDDRRMTLVTADYQCAGRGAGANRWESARGENLLFSLRVMPRSLPARRVFALSEAAALAVRDALDVAASASRQPRVGTQHPMPGGFTVKWPNDVYFGDSKVAGILIENDLQADRVRSSVIGIGINVNQHRFTGDAPNPRSLADIVGHDVSRRRVLERFMECFMHYMRQLDSGDETALDSLHEHYKKHLYLRGKKHKYIDEMGIFCATLTDVEPSGHLILVDDEGARRRYAFKEVQYVLQHL